MNSEYPERREVLKAISRVNAAKLTLQALVEAYAKKREESGAADMWTVEQGKLVEPEMEKLEAAQIALSEHLPKCITAGDAASSLVENILAANDTAERYSSEVKTLCPELFVSAHTAPDPAKATGKHRCAVQ